MAGRTEDAVKRVVVLQSNYLPWKGYFDLIDEADLFVFYDDVQYTVNDWRNRNRIQGPNGPFWLTVPVGNQNDRRIDAVALRDPRWQQKHWKSLRAAYGGAPHFAAFSDFFEAAYTDRAWSHLAPLNQFLITEISRRFLGIETEFTTSTAVPVDGAKGDRLLALLEQVGATDYISGPSARAYLDATAFAERGIAVHWKDYGGYPAYPQRPGVAFDHHVSIVDLLFNTGPDARRFFTNRR